MSGPIFMAALLVLLSIALFRGRRSPDLLMLGVVVLLLAMDVINPQEALGGFSNPYTFALGGFLLVSAVAHRSGLLEEVIQRLFETRRPPLSALARIAGLRARNVGAIGRLVLAVPVLAAILGERLVLQQMLPWIGPMSRRRGVHVSQLLLPLSYAAMMGGLMTLVGTATNLQVAGMMWQGGYEPLGLWSLLTVAMPVSLVVLGALSFFGPYVLPERDSLRHEADQASKSFFVEMMLEAGSPLVGRSAKAAGLRHLEGLFLFRLERGPQVIAPVGPWQRLMAEDRLFFAGSLSGVRGLQSFRGLKPVPEGGAKAGMGDSWVEAVVSEGSPLVGSSIRDVNFRTTYNAAVIAVHRHGSRLEGRIGDYILRSGDTLLLQASQGFAHAFRNAEDFCLISEVESSELRRHDVIKRAVVIQGIMWFSLALLLFPLIPSILVAAVLMILTKCIAVGEARQAVDRSLIVVFAASFGLMAGIENTQLARVIAELLMNQGPLFALIYLYVGCMVLSCLTSSFVVVALGVPVAFHLVQSLGVPLEPYVIAVAVASALALASPRLQHGNGLVAGPGHYRTLDFVKLGVPLQLLGAVVALGALYLQWGSQL